MTAIANSSLESLAQSLGWVVKYTTDGTPSLYYPIPKMKSSDLDASLPNHTHPAFIVNGREIDRRLIAVYKGSSFTANGPIVSLPNMPPRVSLGADELLSRLKLAGPGFGPKTVADSGLILLLAKKNGWSTVKGNNSYGVDYRDGTTWTLAKDITIGQKRVFRGVEYEALIAHTTALELRPDKAPLYWKKGKFIGGTPVASQIEDASCNYNGFNTMTGSGPASWRLGGTPSGIDDLTGNCFDQDYGYRIVNGELQIIADNNAADPNADLSASSAAWKAILPNQSNNGFTLVAPGTTGTLHWTWANSKLTLDTVVPVFDGESRGTYFKDLARNTEHVPYVPYILHELGIFPISGDTTQGYTYYTFTEGERFPRRGGDCNRASATGLGCVYSDSARSSSLVSYGARGGFLENEA